MKVKLGGPGLFLLSLHTPQPCCNWDAKKGDYVFPAKKKLQEYRVLITTLITASRWVCMSTMCVRKEVVGRGDGARMMPGSGVRGQLHGHSGLSVGAPVRPLLHLPLPRLVSAQFPIDHFTHIFIDEAGHSMEPESLVAIAGEG